MQLFRDRTVSNDVKWTRLCNRECAFSSQTLHFTHCAYNTTLFSITYSKLLFISFYFTSVLISSSLIYSKQNRTGASSNLLSTVCKHTYNHVNMYKEEKKSKKKRKKNTETQYKPTILSNMNAKVTYVQTHIIRHTAKINKQEITKAQVESGRKRRLQDTIQTIIKTKYASSLARCRGDQWEIGRNVRNVCFCYRQFTLMFLIGSKWMGSSRV